MAIYAATKAFVLSFSEAIGAELRGTGVTVSALCPGVTITGFQARSGVGGSRLNKMGSMTAVQVAKIGYAALQRGQNIIVPGFLNWLLAFSTRLAPRSLITNMSKRMMEPVGK